MFMLKVHKILFSKFGFENEKCSIWQNILETFVPLSKPKIVYLRPFLTSLQFAKYWKENLMYFGHKHAEIGPNRSHEVDNSLKYHMPLNEILNLP